MIVDGGKGLEAALAGLLWDDAPVQRCTVHKEGNCVHAPKHLHDEKADSTT